MLAPTLDRQKDYRRALGAYPTGVAMVTADAGAGVAAITINSFVSVSLSPALISWSIAETSDRYNVFAQAEDWGLSVLCAAQKDLAAQYAVKGAHLCDPGEVQTLPHGAPTVRNALSRFACRTAFRFPAGDHLIIVGSVTAFDAREGEALTYHRGAFGALG